MIIVLTLLVKHLHHAAFSSECKQASAYKIPRPQEKLNKLFHKAIIPTMVKRQIHVVVTQWHLN